MSILDDAIREHLELKRSHGADEGELKRLEDEAFGPPQRPDEIDPFAEAPTEFLLSPGETPADAPAIGDEAARDGRRPNLTDLQEAPPAEPAPDPAESTAGDAGTAELSPADADAESAPLDAKSGASPSEVPSSGPEDEVSPTPDAPPPSPTDAADLPLPPPPGEAAAADLATPSDEAPAPTDEEYPAGEHQIVADPGPSTEERHAIADQPTQMFDVQAQMDAEGEAPTGAPSPTDEATEAPAGEQASPTDEELVDAAQAEPHAATPAPEETPAQGELSEQQPLESRGPDAEVAGRPPAGAEPEEESAEFDFFNEQRLSDELDQALEAPLPPTDEHIAMPRYEDAPEEGGGIFDFESGGESYEDDPSQEVLRRADEAAEQPAEEAPLDATVEAPRPAPEPPSEETEGPAPEPPSEKTPRGAGEQPEGEGESYDFDPDTGHEDVLEDTPRFLEDAPEDDDLWFEQKPPKDFDLD